MEMLGRTGTMISVLYTSPGKENDGEKKRKNSARATRIQRTPVAMGELDGKGETTTVFQTGNAVGGKINVKGKDIRAYR